MDDMFIHKLIEEQEPEAKQRMWERIAAELNLPINQPSEQEQDGKIASGGKKTPRKNKRRG